MAMDKLRPKINAYLKRVFSKESVKGYLRGFLSTEELLEITLEEICSACPMNRSAASHQKQVAPDREKINECRQRYFAALLQSYLGKPGSEETKWLYSYLKRCEECRFREHLFTSGLEPSSEQAKRSRAE